MVILAHHEIFIQLIQYILVLIAGGWICFKWLFPMLGRWIVDLCKKLEDANKRMEQEREKILEQRSPKRLADDKCVIDALYMDENDIRGCSDSLKHSESKKRSDS